MSNKLYKKVDVSEKIRLDEYIVRVYLLLLLTFFPLVFWDFYFNIADVKFIVFVSLTLIALAFCLIYSIWSRSINIRKVKNAWIWIALWVFSAALSTIFSKHKIIALMGNDGRSFGFITVCCLAVMMVLISNCTIDYRFFINVFLCAGVIVSVLAVFNFLGIDFIGFYNGVDKGLREMFQTTFGHVDICSNYFAISVPVAYFMYMYEENTKRKIFYMFALWCTFMGSFAGGCDSGYIILAVVTVLTLIFMDSYKRLFYSAVAALILTITAKIMMILNGMFEDAKHMDSIAIMITGNKVIIFLVLFMIIMCAVSLVRCDKCSEKEFRIVKIALITILLVIMVALVALFIYFSFIDKDKDIGSLANILRFDDEWGSRRGYIWKRGMQYYADSSLKDKIIGVGPDTLQQSLKKVYGEEMLARFSAYYDNMHNEYMQYLVTTGVLGLVSYMGIVICAIKTAIKSISGNIYMRALFAGMVCYLVQAMVNVNQIITTPYLFIVMAMIYASSVIQVAKQ